jgi:hypothetical protein
MDNIKVFRQTEKLLKQNGHSANSNSHVVEGACFCMNQNPTVVLKLRKLAPL